jgi:cytochrome P450
MVKPDELFGADQVGIHNLYNELRETVNGIHLLDNRKWYLFFRYDDISNALKDPVKYSSDRFDRAPIAEHDPSNPAHVRYIRIARQGMLMKDPPEHTRLRGLVRHSFTPRSLARMRTTVDSMTKSLLDEIETGQEADFMEVFAQILPVKVITEVLGVPEQDRLQFRKWSENSSKPMEASTTGEARTQALNDADTFISYLEDLIIDRRANLGEDLLSLLISAEEEGERLAGEELLAMIKLLLVAGNETTINLLGNGLNLLLDNPEYIETLASNPERMMPGAVDEMLRLEPSFRWIGRVLGQDSTINGATAPAGTWVYLCVAAGNRDPRRYEDPDTFKLGRPAMTHLSFGGGIHYCLGNSLARMESEIAFAEILRRFPKIGRGSGRPTYTPHFNIRHPETLPVVF